MCQGFSFKEYQIISENKIYLNIIKISVSYTTANTSAKNSIDNFGVI